LRAARFDQAARRLEVVDVPRPQAAPGEVLVKVEGCGICLSDVHLIDGSLPASLPVLTPGHEAAGTIEAVGATVPFWQAGQRVAIHAGRPCSACDRCAAGRQDECRNVAIMGFGYDGAWAEFVVVPFFTLAAVPDHLPIEQAAIIADAVSTPFAALTDKAQLRPGESVGVWGVGGLGVHAIKLARLMGATPIVAVDPLPAARERAIAAGADLAFDPLAADLAEKVLTATAGAGLDVAMDVVGSTAVLEQASTCLGRRGRLVMVGMSMEPIALGPGALFSLQSQSLLGHLGYTKQHMEQLLRLAASGRLELADSISEVVALEDVVDAVDRLATKRDNPVRIVIKP
jgi:D-arabinose 1-dehydrogenase-like Zn-dependent alcohol dehydrogenase